MVHTQVPPQHTLAAACVRACRTARRACARALVPRAQEDHGKGGPAPRDVLVRLVVPHDVTLVVFEEVEVTRRTRPPNHGHEPILHAHQWHQRHRHQHVPCRLG